MKTIYSESKCSVVSPKKKKTEPSGGHFRTNPFVPKGYLSLQQFEKELVRAVIERL